MSDLIQIATHLMPWEAHILRGRLESEGIFAAVVDETGFSYAVVPGGARVLVRVEDAGRALEIRRAYWRASDGDDNPV